MSNEMNIHVEHYIPKYAMMVAEGVLHLIEFQANVSTFKAETLFTC